MPAKVEKVSIAEEHAPHLRPLAAPPARSPRSARRSARARPAPARSSAPCGSARTPPPPPRSPRPPGPARRWSCAGAGGRRRARCRPPPAPRRSAVSVSRGCSQVSSTMPPTSASIWRENSEIWWLSTPCSSPMSDGEPAGELAGAALGEEAGRHLEQPGEQLPPEPGHRPLADGAQQVGLDVVEHRLHGEQRHQAERDAVEQRAVAVARTRRRAGSAPTIGNARPSSAAERPAPGSRRAACRGTAAPGARAGPAGPAAGGGASAASDVSGHRLDDVQGSVADVAAAGIAACSPAGRG